MASAADPDSPYYDLGTYHRPITTSSAAADKWFNRGLIWSYGFNHEESAQCFEHAIAADKNCAMAYWGLAYALGPNYNKPWAAFDDDELQSAVRRTHYAVEQAQLCAPHASPVEQALIEALRFRYPRDKPDDDCSIWNRGYADAMKQAYSAFPDDLDVAALYADALMNLTPWQLWNPSTGEPNPQAATLEVKAVLESALASRAEPGGDKHPGLLHLYIHLIEMSAHPEDARTAADGLRGLVPDAGHLNHMPTHIDVLVGDYERGVKSNKQAIEADDRFLARQGAVNFYTLYRMHDMHFRVYCAMFAGQSRAALETGDRMADALPDALLRIQSPPMADWLEGFASMRLHAMVRFGRWADILALPFPADRDLHRVAVPMLHYARGIALAAGGRVAEAESEREGFRAGLALVPESRTIFNNSCVDILRVAEAMLDGELAYRRGVIEMGQKRQGERQGAAGGGGADEVEAAFGHLREAMARSRSLPYDEPWGWMQPPAHALGALLLEQGRLREALDVYADDLGLTGTLPRALQHPLNVWAMHGYHECLVKLGRLGEAEQMEPRLREAVSKADVPIKASCFCRGAAAAAVAGAVL